MSDGWEQTREQKGRKTQESVRCDVCGDPPRPGTVCANRAELKRLKESMRSWPDDSEDETEGIEVNDGFGI